MITTPGMLRITGSDWGQDLIIRRREGEENGEFCDKRVEQGDGRA